MSVDLRDTCALGVTDEQLSALRDEALPPDELRRLNDHAATCPACAERLERHERLGRLLRDQRLPGPTPALWEDVRASIQTRRPHPMRPRWRAAAIVSPRLGAAGALAAALAVVLLFGLVIHALPNGATTLATPTATSAPTARSIPTATSTPAAALTWRQVTPPSSTDLLHDGFAVSPVDGRDAWICIPAATGGFVVWATRDAASTWRQVGNISPTTPEPASCQMQADQADPQSLVAGFTWGSGEAGTLGSMSYYSTDGGAQWYPLSGDLSIAEVSVVRGTTYAILQPSMASQGGPALVVSSDDLRSWRAIRPVALPSNDSFFRIWVTPSGDQLFAATYSDTLWESENEGASWSQVSTPNQQTILGAWLPQANLWLFCGWAGGTTIQLQCSDDSGKTWRSQPTFGITTSCDNCGKGGSPYTSTQPCYPNAVARDGALVAVCPANGSDPFQVQFAVYRLVPGAQAWSSLGPSPSGNLDVSVTGELWSWDAQRGILYVATLPS